MKNFAIDKKRPPYNDSGKTNFNIRNKPGVYLIYKGADIVYIGFSASDVYKALYRHFQKWKDKRQQRIVFDNLKGITVRVVYCKNGSKARSLEGALIIKHRPELNINKYEGFITDEKEKALLKELDNTHPGIYIYKGDLPF